MLVAPFVIFHSRFSTNTAPAWERAQPFRHLCHNGEINTIQGNERRMHARAVLGTEAVGLGPEELFRPVLDPLDSDSGKLDAALELLLRAGRDVRHVVSMLIPEAWEGVRDLDPDVRDYFRFHAAVTEPWDGPAGLIFTDGRRVGASLDRNGLRPMRWQRSADGIVVCCSEAGAVPLSGRGSITRGRLGPGEMLCVDPDAPSDLGPWQDDVTVKLLLAARVPYGEWARDGLLPFDGGGAVEMPPPPDDLVAEQVSFGCNREEIAMVLKPMATDAKEPTFSMGDDTPFAAVATRPRPVFNYVKQRFAQVSNPPIDHLRERLVMSLRTCLGPRCPLLVEDPSAARLLELGTFFLYPDAIDALLDRSCMYRTTALSRARACRCRLWRVHLRRVHLRRVASRSSADWGSAGSASRITFGGSGFGSPSAGPASGSTFGGSGFGGGPASAVTVAIRAGLLEDDAVFSSIVPVNTIGRLTET